MTEQRRIFGTDGVRGVANVEPVTAETALKLGRAAAYVFAQMNPRRTPDGARPKIVLGKDTRLSGYMVESALAAGFVSVGMDVATVGPLPTPAVAMMPTAATGIRATAPFFGCGGTASAFSNRLIVALDTRAALSTRATLRINERRE